MYTLFRYEQRKKIEGEQKKRKKNEKKFNTKRDAEEEEIG